MNYPSDERLREVFNAVERHIEDTYGIPVRISDVPHPFTGDLDGSEIHVDYAQDIENAVFIIAHLFGHTVQWNRCSEGRRLGMLKPSIPPPPALLQELHNYEREACRYSLQMLHDAGIHDLDQWLSDFAACDFAYLEHFYKTGEKRPFRSFWRSDRRRLEPLAIPDFKPQRWISRWDGIVI